MRLFVALDIPDEVRNAVGALVAKLRPVSRSARWVRLEGVHVTLKFIGEVNPEKADAISKALAHVPFPQPVAMNFRGLGFFPNDRRPRVLWVGIEAGPELGTLAENVDTFLSALQVPHEARAFSPHLTLARFDSPGGLGTLRAAIDSASPLEFGTFSAGEFHLYQSVLKRGGSEYTRLATFAAKSSEHA